MHAPAGRRRTRDRRDERVPGGRIVAEGELPGALRVVERQDGRLLERPQRAEARRMPRVALGLGRPPLVALDDHPDAGAAERHRRRVPGRHRRPHLGRRIHVRHDVLGRAPAAPGRARQRGRRPEELQEAGGVTSGARSAPSGSSWSSGASPARSRGPRHSGSSAALFNGGSPCNRGAARPARDHAELRLAPAVRSSRSMSVIALWGRKRGTGSRWQSRHHCIVSGAPACTVAMRSTRPWHSTHPTPCG